MCLTIDNGYKVERINAGTVRYTIPIRPTRKWWQFWKANTTPTPEEAKKTINEFIKKYKEELIITGPVNITANKPN